MLGKTSTVFLPYYYVYDVACQLRSNPSYYKSQKLTHENLSARRWQWQKGCCVPFLTTLFIKG